MYVAQTQCKVCRWSNANEVFHAKNMKFQAIFMWRLHVFFVSLPDIYIVHFCENALQLSGIKCMVVSIAFTSFYRYYIWLMLIYTHWQRKWFSCCLIQHKTCCNIISYLILTTRLHAKHRLYCHYEIFCNIFVPSTYSTGQATDATALDIKRQPVHLSLI